ncbi:MAG: hypothetical protein ACJ78I_06970, partial [Gemmatimonadaceae bacterium]
MILETEHLRLVPHLPSHLLVLIDDPARFEESSGFAAASGLRDFFVSDDVSSGFLSSLRSLRDADPW